jgi:small subunit ribosomal protein S6
MERKYEMGFIVNPTATEEEVKKIIDTNVELIKKLKGKIENVDEWGRKEFAYPINSLKDGYYVFFNIEGQGPMMYEVERKMKLNEKIVRHLVIRLDEREKKAGRLTKKWKKAEKFQKKHYAASGKDKGISEKYAADKEVNDEE